MKQVDLIICDICFVVLCLAAVLLHQEHQADQQAALNNIYNQGRADENKLNYAALTDSGAIVPMCMKFLFNQKDPTAIGKSIQKLQVCS